MLPFDTMCTRRNCEATITERERERKCYTQMKFQFAFCFNLISILFQSGHILFEKRKRKKERTFIDSSRKIFRHSAPSIVASSHTKLLTPVTNFVQLRYGFFIFILLFCFCFCLSDIVNFAHTLVFDDALTQDLMYSRTHAL